MSDRISVIISEPRGDEGRPRDESPRRDESLRRDKNLRRDKSLRRLLDSLAERADVEAVAVPYLADLSTDGPVMQRLRAIDGQMLVAGPFQTRAIHWLLAKNGLNGLFVELEPDADLSELGMAADAKTPSGPTRTVWCLDLRAGGPTKSEPEQDEPERDELDP